jgi:tRNA U55 pseudouridine synthase TruB
MISKSDSLKDFNGILLIDKPFSLSSFDIIRELKRFFFWTK